MSQDGSCALTAVSGLTEWWRLAATKQAGVEADGGQSDLGAAPRARIQSFCPTAPTLAAPSSVHISNTLIAWALRCIRKR